MIVYEVRAVMDAPLVDDYRAWLEDHIREILAIPGFRYAELHREDADQPAASATEALLVIRYHLEDRAGLEAYLRDHAPALRAEGIARFGDRVRLSRRVTELVAAFDSPARR